MLGQPDLTPAEVGQGQIGNLELRRDMINSAPEQTPASQAESVETIVSAGPSGALTIAGIASAIVVALWFAFYLMVFLPRSA